ncbi:ogr/Delta-like zinc finger family protein [Sphingomonas sp. LB3N6]|uniref:ogr/Delta-like zinc finger family protein n=1 Tax=Sphingomonas fucosidasi TaxID=3096164 RepID=UPI002FC723A2
MTVSKPTKHRIPGISCPHCSGPAGIRNSAALTATVRHIRYRCENDDCGHVFVAELQVIRTIVPSARPNPEVRLPFSNPNVGRTRPVPANDDTRTPANDDVATSPAAIGPAPS